MLPRNKNPNVNEYIKLEGGEMGRVLEVKASGKLVVVTPDPVRNMQTGELTNQFLVEPVTVYRKIKAI